jgi:hypothetical protein
MVVHNFGIADLVARQPVPEFGTGFAQNFTKSRSPFSDHFRSFNRHLPIQSDHDPLFLQLK